MKQFLIKGIAAFLLCVPAIAHAQDRIRLEILPGAARATQTLAGASLDAGLGFQANISYRFLPHLAAYGGWDWHHFKAPRIFLEQDIDVENTGYAFGLRFDHPLRSGGSPSLVLRAGGTYTHIELEALNGGISSDTGHGIGWEAGAGLGFRLGGRWQMTPGMRFRSTSREFALINGSAIPGNLKYLTFEVGLSRTF